MRSILVRKLFFQIMTGVLLVLVIFGIARCLLIFNFGNSSLISGHSKDLIRMLVYGLRYDLRIATISLAPCLLLGLVLLPWPSLAESYIKRLHYASVFLGVLALIAAVCNYYYYATYNSFFNVFIFGINEDDTAAVLKSIWNDYPVIRFVAGTVLSGVIFWLMLKRFWVMLDRRSWRPWPKIPAIIFTVIIILSYAISTRGSVGTFPLRRDDAQISNLEIINMATPNAVMALSWAISDHGKESVYPPAENKEGQKLFSALLGRSVPENEVSLNEFADRTPRNIYLEQHPPHVVFALMESMSTHLLTYDAPPKRDMLGSLRHYWQNDFIFTRFLPEGNGTMDSLARLLIASPLQNISQSRAQRTPFESNLLKPYKLRGYRAVFITSGNGAWRNLNAFLKGLGFDEVIAQNDLAGKYPGAKIGAWGTFDEFSFRYAEDRLEEADKRGEKLFIMILSVTNHPPYEVPPTFKQPPHELDDSIRRRLSAFSDNLDSMIAAFQYSNDALGRFIDDLDRNAVGTHTLIAATGDHNMRLIGYPDPQESVLKKAVPFLLHVPHAYQNHMPGLIYDPGRVGSHKDIMPTLYSLSLSDTPYYRRGVNLLAKRIDGPWYFAYNEEFSLSEEGAYRLIGHPEFYPWVDNKGLLVSVTRNLDDRHRSELDRMKAYKSLMMWQLDRQVNRQP